MLGLTSLGVIHTAIALVAVGAALACFVRYGGISMRTRGGVVYVVATVATCLTGFGIFQHGGFGKPHALGVATLAVLAIAIAADQRRAFGRLAPYVEAVAYSLTAFFHVIPGIAETGTRLPPGAPWLDHPEAPAALALTGAFFLVFLLGAAYQVWRIMSRSRIAPAPA